MQWLAGSGCGVQDLPHVFQRFQARWSEGIGPEDDVEPGDVVEICLVERIGTDVTRIDGRAHGLVGKALEKRLIFVGNWRLAERLGQRADLGHDRDGHQSAARFLDGVAPCRRLEVDSWVIDEGHRRTELADCKIAADDAGANDAGPVRVQVGELAVAGLGLGTDDRQRNQAGQAEGQDRDRILDHEICDADPETRHGDLLQALGLGIGSLLVVRRLERPEDRSPQP